MERKPGRIERLPPIEEPPATVVYHVSTAGCVGGLQGVRIGVRLLAAIILFGILTFAVALWIALGLAVLGTVSNALRGAFVEPRPLLGQAEPSLESVSTRKEGR